MAGWAALVVCLIAAAAVAADDYYSYETGPESWRHIAPVAHTTSQEELDAVVSQLLAHDKPEEYLDSFRADPDAGVAEVEVFLEMETTKEGDEHSHSRHPRQPDGYYYSPQEYLRPVVVAAARKDLSYAHALPQADYYYEEDWSPAPVKHVVAKPALAGSYRHWGYEPAKHVEYVDYKPVYVEKPRFREADFVETKEFVAKDGAWPGDFVDRKSVYVEKSVDSRIKPLPYRTVFVDRPVFSKEYVDYDYRPHVVSKEVLVPVRNYHAKPYVLERFGGDTSVEKETVVRDGPEGEEIVEVEKDVKEDVDKKLIIEPIVREDGVETIIAEEEDKDINEDVQETVHLVSEYDKKK